MGCQLYRNYPLTVREGHLLLIDEGEDPYLLHGRYHILLRIQFLLDAFHTHHILILLVPLNVLLRVRNVARGDVTLAVMMTVEGVEVLEDVGVQIVANHRNSRQDMIDAAVHITF